MIPLKRLRNASYDQGIESLADRLVGGCEEQAEKTFHTTKFLMGM
jgi:hypothetical protein